MNSSQNNCPICGELWKEHDFGVPHPICPKEPLQGKSWYPQKTKQNMNILKKIKAWLRKDSRLLVRNGQRIIDNNKFYNIKLATPNPQTKTENVIDKNTNVTNFPVLSGNNDADISTDWIQDIINGIDSWTSMDVYARCQQVDDRGNNIGEAILVSVYNPTIGCPYCIVQTSGGFYYSQSLDQNKGLDLMMTDGRNMRISRDSDSDVKEWKVDVDI